MLDDAGQRAANVCSRGQHPAEFGQGHEFTGGAVASSASHPGIFNRSAAPSVQYDKIVVSIEITTRL
jgi:hypothetical protein